MFYRVGYTVVFAKIINRSVDGGYGLLKRIKWQHKTVTSVQLELYTSDLIVLAF